MASWFLRGDDCPTTDLGNLNLLCSHHHQLVHDHGWHLERLDDGGLRVTGPGGRCPHPTTTPAAMAPAAPAT